MLPAVRIPPPGHTTASAVIRQGLQRWTQFLYRVRCCSLLLSHRFYRKPASTFRHNTLGPPQFSLRSDKINEVVGFAWRIQLDVKVDVDASGLWRIGCMVENPAIGGDGPGDHWCDADADMDGRDHGQQRRRLTGEVPADIPDRKGQPRPGQGQDWSNMMMGSGASSGIARSVRTT
jgi:hypothetical protein